MYSKTTGFEETHVSLTCYHSRAKFTHYTTGYLASSNNTRDAESLKVELLHTIFST
jgi:hypothetical protein